MFLPQAANQSISERRDISRSECENEIAWLEFGQKSFYDGVEVAWGPEGENKRGINPGAPDVFFRGDGEGHFAESTRECGLVLEKPLCSYACVFSDVDELAALNSLVHPAVGAEITARRAAVVDSEAVVVLDIPLLVRADGEPVSEEYRGVAAVVVVRLLPGLHLDVPGWTLVCTQAAALAVAVIEDVVRAVRGTLAHLEYGHVRTQ